MGKGRLEAFSDGVIAVIITIMVLELKAPHGQDLAALAPDPPLLLMDEPTAALDPARRGALGEALRRLAKGGRGLLVATHDAEFARAHADRIVRLTQGEAAT